MRKLSLALVAAVLSATTFLSCKDSYIDPTEETFTRDTTTISAYAKSQQLAVKTGQYGIRYVITKPNPAGKAPFQYDELEILYKISKLDATVLETNPKDTAIYLRYLLTSIPVGLEAGLSTMREGESAVILAPSYAAFGAQDAFDGRLLANTPVRFDVTLLRTRSEDAMIEDFIARNKLTVTEKQPSGLRVSKTTAVPTGAALTDGQTVTVKYTGRNLRGTTPFDAGSIDVSLGRNQTVAGVAGVAGFEAGIKTLRVGEKATLVFPSTLGYGSTAKYDSRGQLIIVPYSPLAFDIEILSAR
jgi:FKBP-type peptidyl-prolyl cis-trans isomerase